jgi:hypothetical protein
MQSARRWKACCLAAQLSQLVLPNAITPSKVLSRLKSGPDYTRLPLIAMENMKFGPGLMRMHDPFRCRCRPMTT